MKFQNFSTICKGEKPVTFLKLGMKSIVIKDTPRKVEAYVVLPSISGNDCKCRLLYKRNIERTWNRSNTRHQLMSELVQEYPNAVRV